MTMRSGFAKLLSALTLLLAVCLASPVHAIDFDIEDVIARVTLERLERGVDERGLDLARHENGDMTAIVAIGASTFFIDRFDKAGTRLSRSRPLPLAACHLAPTGTGTTSFQSSANHGGIVSLFSKGNAVFVTGNNCLGRFPVFVQDGDGNIVSFQPAANEVIVWSGPKRASISDNLKPVLPLISAERRPSATAVLVDADRFSAAQFVASAALIRSSATQERTSALTALRSRLGQIDWRTPDISDRDLNDVGFALSAQAGCTDLDEAVAMLRHVTRRSPQRGIAYLNLADAKLRAYQQKCPLAELSFLAQAQEDYRLYCTVAGVAAIAPSSRRRLQTALNVPRLTKANCHPKFAMERAIMADNVVALRAALSDPANDVNVTFPNSKRALGLALERKSGEMARLILAAGADPDRGSYYDTGSQEYEFVPLVRAIWNYDLETVNALLAVRDSLHFTMSNPRYPPLLIAADLNANSPEQERIKLAVLQAIARYSAISYTVNSDRQTALHKAVSSYSTPELLQYLLDQGAFINQNASYGRSPILSFGPFDPEKTTRTLNFLISHGANVNQQDDAGNTPLTNTFVWAGSNKETQARMVRIYLRAGANPNLPNKEGHTALTYAAMRGFADIVDELIAGGARVQPTSQYQIKILVWLDDRLKDPASPEAEAYRRIRAALAAAQ